MNSTDVCSSIPSTLLHCKNQLTSNWKSSSWYRKWFKATFIRLKRCDASLISLIIVVEEERRVDEKLATTIVNDNDERNDKKTKTSSSRLFSRSIRTEKHDGTTEWHADSKCKSKSFFVLMNFSLLFQDVRNDRDALVAPVSEMPIVQRKTISRRVKNNVISSKQKKTSRFFYLETENFHRNFDVCRRCDFSHFNSHFGFEKKCLNSQWKQF